MLNESWLHDVPTFRRKTDIRRFVGIKRKQIAIRAKFRPKRSLFSYCFFQSSVHRNASFCGDGDSRGVIIGVGYWYIPQGREIKA